MWTKNSDWELKHNALPAIRNELATKYDNLQANHADFESECMGC